MKRRQRSRSCEAGFRCAGGGFPTEWPRVAVVGSASAVPALKQRSALGAQCTRGIVCARGQTPRSGVERSYDLQQRGLACVGLTERQAIEQPPVAIGTNDRFSLPVGGRPVPQLCVHRRPLPGMVIPIIVRPLVRVAELDDRDEPVPVQHGDVSVVVRRGVPAEKVIVITANFAWRVVMADVVIVGLRQRHVEETENQNSDSQVAFAAPESTPIKRHNSTPFPPSQKPGCR